MNKVAGFFAAVCVMAGVGFARAGLTVVLSPAGQNAAQGTQLLFNGTLTNTDTTGQIYLNDLTVTLAGNAAGNLTLKPNTFFANVPGILVHGEAYTGPIFSVALGNAAPAGDYSGTVTIVGGTDIGATSSLGSADFAVLSPAVNLVASDASASEFGPDPGVFTISRSGRTDVDLVVSYALSGTATNGTSYVAIPLSVTIPAGSASADVVITPIVDHVVEGDRTATLTLATSGLYNRGANIAATVTIHDLPADQWRLEQFGANANDAAAADTGDWDHDGLSNLMEYALNLDPKTPDAVALPVPAISGGYLTLSYVPNAAAIDVIYSVEASTDLVHWSTVDVESVSLVNPVPPNRVAFRYKNAVSATNRAFLCLRVTRALGP